MIHQMTLFDNYFFKVKSREKKFEIRLYDKKRRNVNPGDTIIFKKFSKPTERICVKVGCVKRYENFNDLSNHISLKAAGFDHLTKEEVLEIIHRIYSRKDEYKWGTVAIEIIPIESDIPNEKVYL